MPLVAHIDLPTFQRLHEEGEEILASDRASQQDIREMHIGLLNIMPDAALEATERQFFRLVGACNQIVQFHVHPFTVAGLKRSPEAQAHIDKYYESFEQIKHDGLDALIISGANVIQPQPARRRFLAPADGSIFLGQGKCHLYTVFMLGDSCRYSVQLWH